MSPIVVAVIVIVVLAAVFVATASARRDRARATGFLSRETIDSDSSRLHESEDEHLTGREVERQAVLERRGESVEMVPAAPAPPPVPIPIDEQTYGVSRRQFLNRGIVSLMTLSLTSFGATTIAFLWPQLKGGFGSKIKVGKIDDIKAAIAEGQGFYYYAAGRMYLTEYPSSALGAAKKVYTGGVLEGMEKAGLVALYQKCVHLGCRVPECKTSQWFECPCHGSKYNQVGEKTAGPAPRGMDRFPMSVEGDVVGVDTSQVIQGPRIGTNTTGQQPEGPFCA